MNRSINSLFLADGTKLENSSCGFANKTLWCWIGGLTMADCFSIFSDPEKTKEITCPYYTYGLRYKGFTEIELIRKGMDSMGNETVDVKLVPVGDNYTVEEYQIEPEAEEDDEHAEVP